MPTSPEVAPSLQSPPPVGWAAPLLDILVALLRSTRWSCALGAVTLLAVAAAYVARAPYYRASVSAVLLTREKPVLDARVTTDSLSTTSDQASRGQDGHQLMPAQVKLYTSLVGARATLLGVIRQVPEIGPEDDTTIRALAGSIRTETSEEGLVTIEVTTESGQLAADLANAVLHEVQHGAATIERGLGEQQLAYLRTSLAGVNEQLEQAERNLATFCARNSVLDPSVQAERHAHLVNDAIAARDRTEAAVQKRSVHFTDADPELRRLRTQWKTQDAQVARLRGAVMGKSGERDYGHLVVTYDGLVGEISDLRDLRQVLIAKQRLQQLRVESPPANLVVLRPALAPLLPAGPSKKRYLAVGFGVWIFGALALAVLFAQWRSALRHSWVRRRRRQVYKLLGWQSSRASRA